GAFRGFRSRLVAAAGGHRAGLACPSHDIAVLIQGQRSAAQQTGLLTIKIAELFAVQDDILAPDILQHNLFRQPASFPRQLLRGEQIGDCDVGVTRNEQRVAIVVEEAVGFGPRTRDRFGVVKDRDVIDPLEDMPHGQQFAAVRLSEYAALHENIEHHAAIVVRVGRIGDLLGPQHGDRIVPEGGIHRWKEVERLNRHLLDAHDRKGEGRLHGVLADFDVVPRQPEEDVEHGPGQDFRHQMRPLIIDEGLHGALVDGAAQIGPAFDGIAKFVRDIAQRVLGVQVAFGLDAQFFAKRVVAKYHEERGEVADELVKGRGLRRGGFVEVGPDAVEHGMAKLVIDNISRKAGVDAIFAAVEVIELQRFALPIVKRVLAETGMRQDDQPAAFEAPEDFSPEAETAFIEVEGVLYDRPGMDLMELQIVLNGFDALDVLERLAVGTGKGILLGV